MILTNALFQEIDVRNLKLEQFREIAQRLFAAGIILRDEDANEQRLYDEAIRIEPILTEYFSLAGFRLVHDNKNDFLRLYAPGAQVPGMAEDGHEPVPALRVRLSADFVAAALALRFLYQQGLTEAGNKLTDNGEVLISFEELAATLQTQIKRSLPEALGERDRLLKELKRHRLLRFNSNFSMSDEDALMAIRPAILGLIGEDALAAALCEEGIDTEGSEEQVHEGAV
jgi:Domain of unknown function (DUF4194)